MPLPKPGEDESRADFIERCMADDAMNTEYPKADQRVAVCTSQWERRSVMEPDLKAVYGDSEGPLGLTMSSEAAKYVEGVIKGLPDDCKELVASGPMRLAKGAQIVPALEPRTEVAFVTTDSVDRDGEVMLPKGMDWSQWRKNPVVTFGHDYNKLPVGRGMWVKRSQTNGRDGFLAKTQYIERPVDWESDWFVDAVWHYVREGYLPGRSIGFIPTEVRAPNEKEIVARPELAGVQRMIAKAIILEYAVCTVQSNPDALLDSAAKGIKIPDFIADELGLVAPVIVPAIEPEPVVKEKAPVMPQRVVIAPDAEETAKYRTPKEIREEMAAAALSAAADVDVSRIVEDVIARMRGRVV